MMEVPISDALTLLNSGMKDWEVAKKLEENGFNMQQISDALNQAKIKQGVEGNMPPQQQQPQMQESIMDPTQDFDIPFPGQEQQVQQQPAAQQQSYSMPAQSQMNYEEMQAVVEQIVEEKWKEMMKNVGDINLFKSRVSDDMESVKQELLRTQKRLEDLQNAVLGKVHDYNDNLIKIGDDMKALEQVFGRILEPLTSNIKELNRITEELKKK